MLNHPMDKDHREPTMETPPFKPAAWLNKIDFINHLVLLNNVLITVLAEKGGGKSTFAQILKSSLDSGVKTGLINAEAPLNVQQVLSKLYEAFHLRIDAEQSLSNFVQQVNERKVHVLVIIDNAQLLPDLFIKEALLEIKKQGNTGFFHLCLVSDYSLAASINSLDKDLFDNLIHSIELGGLSESETKTYLLKFLPSPRRLDKTMTDKRLAQFYQLTGGYIGRINTQMQDFFNPDTLKASRPRRAGVKAYGLLGAALVGLGFAYTSTQNQTLAVAEPVVEPAPAPIPGPQFQEVASLMELPAPSVFLTVPEEKLVSSLPNLASNSIQLLRSHIEPALVTEIPSWTVASSSQELQPPPMRRVIEFNTDEDDELNNLVVMDKVVVIPKTVNKVNPHTVPAKSLVSNKPTKTLPVRPAETSKPAVIQTAKTSKPAAAQFTIQILASRNADDLKRFVARHIEAKNGKIYRTLREGSEWFVLTLGNFPDLSKAQLAVKALPGELAQRKPWVRSTSSLKAIG